MRHIQKFYSYLNSSGRFLFETNIVVFLRSPVPTSFRKLKQKIESPYLIAIFTKRKNTA
jgi:hypothetical protein